MSKTPEALQLELLKGDLERLYEWAGSERAYKQGVTPWLELCICTAWEMRFRLQPMHDAAVLRKLKSPKLFDQDNNPCKTVDTIESENNG